MFLDFEDNKGNGVFFDFVRAVLTQYAYNFGPCGMLVSCSTNRFIHIKGNITFVLMHSSIVNGHQLQCDAHTVPELHRGTAAFFFITHYCPFLLFLLCVCHSDSAFSFLGCLDSL